MKHNTKNPTTALSRWTRFLAAMLMLALLVPAAAVSQKVYPNAKSVNLGAAGTYRALAGTGLSIGTLDTVYGNAGGNTTVSNLGKVWGTTDTANANSLAGFNALTAAIGQLGTRTADSAFGATVDIGGMLLGRGVYVGGGTLTITGTLTLTGVATDTIVIRTGSPGTSFIATTGSTVVLIGIPASNVFWVAGSSAELQANAVFKGNILAGTSVLTGAGVRFDGRALGLSTVTLGSSVLPVELVSFSATANRLNANLHWSTATETNNYGFEIERRQIGNWEKIGFVAGAGSSSSPRNYSYTDNNLSPGSYAYRIKQINKDGSFSYRGSAEVEIGSAPQEFALIQNYPNPFNPSTRIQYSLEKAGAVSLKVYNVLGLEVATLVNGAQEAGSYTVPFNAQGLSSGVYFYRLQTGSFVSTKKLILMK